MCATKVEEGVEGKVCEHAISQNLRKKTCTKMDEVGVEEGANQEI